MIERAKIGIASRKLRSCRYYGIPKIPLAALFLLFFITSSVTLAEHRSPYSYHMSLLHDLPAFLPDQMVVLPLKIKNTSGLTWSCSAEHPINLSHHWLNAR